MGSFRPLGITTTAAAECPTHTSRCSDPSTTLRRRSENWRTQMNREHSRTKLQIQPPPENVVERIWPFKRPAVFVGHPGHELRVLGWLAETRPRVHVLTDGSGASGCSRLPSTSRLLDRIEACRGEV